MKLIGETRFDVGDDDAKEHALPEEERYGLVLVFACKPEERVALKDFAEQLVVTQQTHILIRREDVTRLQKEVERLRDAPAESPARSLLEIPGVYVQSYEMKQTARGREYGGYNGESVTSFAERGISVRIDVATSDNDAADELMRLLQGVRR